MNYLIHLLALVFVFSPLHSTSADIAPEDDLSVSNMRVEYFENPLGLGEVHPRLSWKITTNQNGFMQEAYRIQVSTSPEFDRMVWDTGKINSDTSVQVVYKGEELKSAEKYYWRVKIWGNDGGSVWSEPAHWEMGLLNADDWKTSWVEPGFEQDSTFSQPSPMFRTEFSLKNKVIQSARAYVTSHGVYEMFINGEKVGDRLFTPGWTSYNKRLQYQTYDVTSMLDSGDNAIGMVLGDGWYRGLIGFNEQRNYYGKTLGFITQIAIEYADGETQIIGSNDAWKSSTGPIVKSDIYNGETYDARLEKEGWTQTNYDDSNWSGVTIGAKETNEIVAPEGPPVKKIQELKPKRVFTTPEGDTVVDMGQNMVGWARINVQGERGTKIVLEHAEVLDKNGNFYTENLRSADQTNTYILSGNGEETFAPHFTFQGFRYIRVNGFPGEIQTDNITGVVIHSDMAPTGHFETSNANINRLQHNIVWGQKGNFLDVPTDCPQRNERLGWTGDIQVFSSTACYNMDSAGFLTKWLRDLKLDQLDNGSVPHVVPNVLGPGGTGSSGWGDASVIVPWALYQAYGDTDILKTQYESMKGWVDFMKERAMADSTTYLWDNNFSFGDWLSFNTTESDYPGAYTDKALISTAFFARSTDLLQRTAGILGKNEDQAAYRALFDKIKGAFNNEYMTTSGRVMSNTQTAYLLALQFNLVPEDQKQRVAEYLVSRIDEMGHLTTGFLGTPYLNPVLSDYGYDTQAYELLLRNEYPSWLYPVTMGATTIWERWDGMKPDSTFQNAGMNSFNHYAYGAIGEWMYKNITGIQSSKPGYKEIKIAPKPSNDFSYARSFVETMYGKVESKWHLNNGDFILTTVIPPNTSAEIVLPVSSVQNMTLMQNNNAVSEELYRIESGEEYSTVRLGSGSYTITIPANDVSLVEAMSDKETPMSSFTAESEIAEILANPQSREIFQEHLPSLYNSAWLSQIMNFTLKNAATALPRQYHFDGDTMENLLDDLKSI